MSHTALQRLVVRMLYDPELADAIASGAVDTGSAGVDPQERAWLLAVDPRAFRVDPLRRTRSLHALLQEFPASAASVASGTGDVRELDGFFSSPVFHGTIQDGGSLAAGFAAYMEERWAGTDVAALARLEGAMAALRRASAPRTDSGGGIALSTWVAVVRLPAGTLERLQRVMSGLAALGPDPVATLVTAPPRLGPPKRREDEPTECILLQRQEAGDINATLTSGELADLLAATRRPTDPADLVAAIAAHGLDAAEAGDVLQGLIDDGVLMAGVPLRPSGPAALAGSSHPVVADTALPSPAGDPSRHLDLDALRRGLARGAAPRTGRVALIVSRREDGRATPERVELVPGEGIPGDSWTRRENRDPDAQITVMDVRVAELIGNGQPLATFGDNIFVDLDLASLPPGTLLRIGTVKLQVTPKAHTGCRKFQARFGPDALRFVSMPELRHLNLRGIYVRALDPGEIAVGDPVERVTSA